MALFKVDIEKSIFAEYWTNRYVVSTGSIENAQEAALIIVAAEQEFHRSVIDFTKMRVSTFVAGDDTFIVTPLSGSGNLPSVSGGLLPLWNVMRVDFAVEGFGRPSRKFYRSGIMAGDVTIPFEVTGDILTQVAPILNQMIVDLNGNASPLVDVDGQLLSSAISFAKIGMRQLRRGSKRRTEPVL